MRALFVGLGGIGQRHLRNLRSLLRDQVTVLAYRVRGESQVLNDQLQVVEGANLEDAYGVQVCSSLDDALSRRPDVAFITNPTSLHVPVALKAAQAGCHLFIEKPLSASLDSVNDLSEAVRRHALVGLVAYQWRFHPGFKRLQQVVSSGELGRILFCNAEVGEYLPDFHRYEDYRRMYAARRELGGGVTLSQIHEIDYLMALFGMPVRVCAMGGKFSDLQVDVDDVSSSLLQFRGKDAPIIAHLHQDYVQRPRRRQVLVVGERGKVFWDLAQGRWIHHGADGSVVNQADFADYPRNQPYLEELQHFLQCVATGETPKVSIEDAVQSLKIALAILRSQNDSRPIEPGGREAA